jgi:esterase/lipase superfamily enzyme
MRELSNNLEARSASDELRRDKDDVFLYIHGFNNPFSKALRKTAQLTLDLGFRGIPMSYSWPAQNVSVPMPWDFRTDALSIEKSLPQFNSFLKEHTFLFALYASFFAFHRSRAYWLSKQWPHFRPEQA